MIAEWLMAAALVGPPKTIQDAPPTVTPSAVVEAEPVPQHPPTSVAPLTDAAGPAHTTAAADTAAAPSESVPSPADSEGCIPQPFPATGCYDPHTVSYEPGTYIKAPGTPDGSIVLSEGDGFIWVGDADIVTVLPVSDADQHPLSHGPADPDAFQLSEGGIEVAG